MNLKFSCLKSLTESSPNAKVYVLVKVGKGSKTQNATTKAWAKGRFKLPKSNKKDGKNGKEAKVVGGEFVLEGLPDSITFAYNEKKTYRFREGYRDVYSDGSKGKLVGGLATCSVSRGSLGEIVSVGVSTSPNGNSVLTVEGRSITKKGCFVNSLKTNTYDLPMTGTITVSAVDKSKTIKVTVTDFGTPDKKLDEKWYRDVIHLSGADKINKSNIADYYNSFDGDGKIIRYQDGEDGLIDFSKPPIIELWGDRYQWSVEFAKARNICMFFEHQYKYSTNTIEVNGNTELNWYHAQKHGNPYIGYTCYANFLFADVCQYAGINAVAYPTRTIQVMEDIPEELRSYAKQYDKPYVNHILTVVRYGKGGIELMDATPQRGSGTTGEPINEFLARIKSLEN